LLLGCVISSRLRDLQVPGGAPWAGHEYVRGWGVFGLPFDSGHVLALRVFPENDFAPYRTLWHRDPAGRWSIHVDGPRLETACPRYYGSASESTGFANIDLTWTGPASLRVLVDSPSLEWTLTASEPRYLRLLTAIGARLPLWTWRHEALLRPRERLAHWLGAGDLRLSGVMPSGHAGTLMPQRMYFIEESEATLDGIDLGRPTRSDTNPSIGGVPLPARGILAIGQAAWEILDHAEYERTRNLALG
jgi:hypothetical protein